MNRVNPFLFLVLLFGMAMLMFSCEKVMIGGDPGEDRMEMFQELWQDISDRYSYLTEKNLNWDSVFLARRPIALSVMSEKEYFDFLADLLYILRDGHANLTSPFDRSRNWEWFLNYPPNFDANIAERNYLGSDYRQAGPLKIQVLDEIVYVYCGSFAREIKRENLRDLEELLRDAKGLIIDIRNNGGGQLKNANFLGAWLAEQDFVYGLHRTKTGPGPADFSSWRVLEIEADDFKRQGLKVALLTNRRVYSAANSFAQMVKVMPKTAIIGDTTGGGGGTPMYGELANGWIYRFSATQTVSPEGEHLEFGIPPDIFVQQLPEDVLEGRDPIIEAAINWIEGR